MVCQTDQIRYFQMKGNIYTVKTAQNFKVTTPVLWKAITEVQQMKKWFFPDIPAFTPEVGFKTGFMVDAGERKFLHLWEIIEVKQKKKIVYSWSYDGYKGKAHVTFTLEDITEGSRLTLTHKIIEAFTDDIPEFTIESCKNGWTYFINTSLKNYLTPAGK